MLSVMNILTSSSVLSLPKDPAAEILALHSSVPFWYWWQHNPQNSLPWKHSHLSFHGHTTQNKWRSICWSLGGVREWKPDFAGHTRPTLSATPGVTCFCGICGRRGPPEPSCPGTAVSSPTLAPGPTSLMRKSPPYLAPESPFPGFIIY